LGGHPQTTTPNIDQLAKRGVSFTRAYCSAPLCNPSRISLLTGILPSNSGVYGNDEQLSDKLPDAVTLMQYLKGFGYTTQGGGKIFHGTGPGDPDSWDYYHRPTADRQVGKRDDGLAEDAWTPWGPLDVKDSDMFDVKNVDWAISELEKSHDKPFFLACGFTKPHMPWYVPQKYFDMHPLESIELPITKAGDLDDVPDFGKKLAMEVYDPSGEKNFAVEGGDHNNILANHQWHRAVQSYLATISFVDAHVGRLLGALDKSAYSDNTIVVLWGDHGWHLGEKEHWRKHALWDVTTRTTLILSAPEGVQKNQLCERVVSLIDLYPTLVELCGLPGREGLDGQSLVPLLKDPKFKWDRPALTTYGYKNHAVQTERWRYIRYHDGGEELYDHMVDPNEWTNLASDSKLFPVIQKLQQMLPETNIP
jgi:arylsulfatase A-like enzyme